MRVEKTKKQHVRKETAISGTEQNMASLLSRKLLATAILLSPLAATSQTLAKVDNGKVPNPKEISYSPKIDNPDSLLNIVQVTPPDTMPKNKNVKKVQFADNKSTTTTTTTTSVMPSNKFVGKNFTAELGDGGKISFDSYKLNKKDSLWHFELSIKKQLQSLGLPENAALSDAKPMEGYYNNLPVLYLCSDSTTLMIPLNPGGTSSTMYLTHAPANSKLIRSDIVDGLRIDLFTTGISNSLNFYSFAVALNIDGSTVSENATTTRVGKNHVVVKDPATMVDEKMGINNMLDVDFNKKENVITIVDGN